jgi:TPR repeat protein
LAKLAAISSVFMKLPALVQIAVTDCLSQIGQSADETVRRAAAQFNLVICYVNGYGVEADLGKASRLILDAATLGSTKAQVLYADIFQHIHSATSLDPDRLCERLDWINWRKAFVRFAIVYELPGLITNCCPKMLAWPTKLSRTAKRLYFWRLVWVALPP